MLSSSSFVKSPLARTVPDFSFFQTVPLPIKRRETELNDDEELDTLFERHIAALPETDCPKTRVQERRMFNDWEGGRKSELTDWKDELDELENRPIDKPLIFSSAINYPAASSGVLAGTT